MAKTSSDYARTWREKHPNSNRERLARFRAEHPERVKEHKRRYYQKNKAKIIEASKRWREANPERVKEAEREASKQPHRQESRRFAKWRYRYGLNKSDAVRALVAQEHACAICRRPFDTHSCLPYLDHCHDSQKLRGFLCNLCNVGLGSFRDSAESLSSAIAYLARGSLLD